MGLLAFLLLGLLAGAIARSVMGERGTWVTSLVVGVLGSMLGGWLGVVIFRRDINEFFSLYSWLMAIGGSVLVLIIWRGLRGRR